jgi:thiol-disulfide isomerase/thioredoxin
MGDMKEFTAKYGQSDEAPDVLFQLASNSEFNGEDKEAKDFYNQLIAAFPETVPGKKAAGALHRQDLVGKSIALKGKGLDGQSIDLAQYRGKTVLVAFWATWSPPVKRDMPEIVKIYDKNKNKGFEVVGIWLDTDPAALQAALHDVPKSWPQVFEQGALESRLAVEYGIMSVPTMFLVDPEGKVINRNIRSAADLDIQLDKALAGKNGVAFGKP